LTDPATAPYTRPTDRSVELEREGVVMTYEVKLLDILDIELEASFLVLARGMGTTARVKTWSYLILGGDDPIIVDTGASEPEIMERLGMTGIQTPEMTLEAQLGRHGVAMDDIRYVLHTHHHIDHAGQDHRFPKATVVTNRRELEYSASGIMGGQYPPEYVKHHIDRLHTPGALRLLDLELSGPDEILPGIVCEAAGGHTEGSMNINVATADGTACICGDVIYDIQNQIVDPIYQVLDYEPQSTGNQGTSKREERAAIKRALNSGTFVLPIHDWPARVRNGRVLSRLVGDSVPGPEVEIDHRTTSETSEMGLGADYWRPVLAAAP
jgi:glyoxylase-like metal-dependent hydrolase (beta-lactamase superfamily II)